MARRISDSHPLLSNPNIRPPPVVPRTIHHAMRSIVTPHILQLNTQPYRPTMMLTNAR